MDSVVDGPVKQGSHDSGGEKDPHLRDSEAVFGFFTN